MTLQEFRAELHKLREEREKEVQGLQEKTAKLRMKMAKNRETICELETINAQLKQELRMITNYRMEIEYKHNQRYIEFKSRRDELIDNPLETVYIGDLCAELGRRGCNGGCADANGKEYYIGKKEIDN